MPRHPDPKEGCISVTLHLKPHDLTQLRARRFSSPDLRRLLLPEWWSKSLFGHRAGRDPIPTIDRVVVSKKVKLMLEQGGCDSTPDPEEKE